jgi:hypothetical protein
MGRKSFNTYDQTQIEQPIVNNLKEIVSKLSKSIDQVKTLTSFDLSDMERKCMEIVQQSPTRKNLISSKSNLSDNEMFLDWAEEKLSTVEKTLWGPFERLCSTILIIGRKDLSSGDNTQILTRIREEIETLKVIGTLIVSAATCIQDKALDKVHLFDRLI